MAQSIKEENKMEQDGGDRRTLKSDKKQCRDNFKRRKCHAR